MKNNIPNYNEVVFTLEELEDIKNSYVNNKESSVKIGKRYGVGHHTILKALNKMGIERNQSRIIRKYALNEEYFDCIDTPNKAYILGFLYADGSNCLSKGTITMSLEECDCDILERIRQELDSEKPLEYLDYSNKHDFGYTYKNQYRLLLHSSHMCSSLKEIGMIPNKSLKLIFPNISKELYPHFIRGYFDGDGSVYRYIKKNGGEQFNLTITSTENFCKSIADIVMSVVGINVGIYDASCHNGITKVATISGRNAVKKFMDWIYENTDLFLQRKHDRYIDYFYTNKSLSA